MNITAFVLIICSAFMHATWNLIAKKNHFSIPFYLILESTCFVCWGHAMWWSPVQYSTLPHDFWYCVLGSGVFDLLYGFGIQYAYGALEMSMAYPMMRSLPLIFTAILTSIFGWGQPLSGGAIMAMVIVFCGCLMIPLAKFKDLSWKAYCNKGSIYILMVACAITGYTLFDSTAQRVLMKAIPDLPKFTVALTYYSFRMLCLISGLFVCTITSAKYRAIFLDLIKHRKWQAASLAGLIASTTFVLVLMAMNYVTNVSYVQAFRQVGLIIGMAEGIILLHEKASWPKVIGVGFIVLGLALSFFL